MSINQSDKEILSALRQHMEAQALSQLDVGRKLSVTQGHLSKVLAGGQPLSRKLRKRIADAYPVQIAQDRSAFEESVIAALRKSTLFRSMVVAALQLLRRSEQDD